MTNPADDKNTLIAELKQTGVKHTPEEILRIARLPNGKIGFLETGNASSGLQHILENHKDEFAEKGIYEADVTDAVFLAVIQQTIVDYQKPNRPIYQITFNGKTQLIAVTVGSNGYIVCANPRSTPQQLKEGEIK